VTINEEDLNVIGISSICFTNRGVEDMSTRKPPRDEDVGNDAMVAAVFRALGGFAEAPEEKLKAVIRAGEKAEAILLLIQELESPVTESRYLREQPFRASYF
jgi:hypothetical protein